MKQSQMNRHQKVEFIKTNYPELYKLLQENASDFLANIQHLSFSNIYDYNTWVAFYCGKTDNINLMKKLLL